MNLFKELFIIEACLGFLLVYFGFKVKSRWPTRNWKVLVVAGATMVPLGVIGFFFPDPVVHFFKP